MTIWALADLHLSFGVPGKEMDVFGEKWKNHPEKIRANWIRLIAPDDLVLIPGDISWAMNIEEAQADLNWIDTLPGTKVMLKGNHDYWWTSLNKIEKRLPPSIHVIQNNVFIWKDVAIAGSRLWDTSEYSFQSFIEFTDNPRAKKLTAREEDPAERERIFLRELARLELSLKCLPKSASLRLAMTHYPPIGADLADSRASQLLEKYHISACLFGHLHNVKHDLPMFGAKNGVRYTLVAADYVHFEPILVK